MTTLTMVRARRRRSLLVGRELARFLVGAMAMFFPIIVVIFVALGFLQAAVGGFDDGSWASVWEYAEQPLRYFPMAIGIMFTPVVLPAFVSNGVTRRDLTLGLAGVILAASVVIAMVALVGYWIENLVFSQLGEPQTFLQHHLFGDAGDVLPLLGEQTMLTSIHLAVGWLIGTVYYRYGPWIGTVSLVVTVLPAIAVEAFLAVSWAGGVVIDDLGIERRPLGVVIPVCLAIVVGTFSVIYLFTRRLAIRP